MKKQLFRNCTYVSTFLFLGFIGLYAYVWLENPNPQVTKSGIHWSYISIGHSAKPLTETNTATTGTYVYDGGCNIHFTVTKGRGGNLVFFNQSMPLENIMLAFTGNNRTNETYFNSCGIHFGSFKYTGRMVGLTNDDRSSETYLMGYGIYFRHITHTVEMDKSWWTLMIGLWYPIIIFGILPIVFVVKKLRAFRCSSRKDDKGN